MEHDDVSESQPHPPKAEPMSAPTDAELSRIAREAVRQPADPRLDRQLERMGLSDTPERAEPRASQASDRPASADPELERLRARTRRLEAILWVLAAAVVMLAAVVVVLLIS